MSELVLAFQLALRFPMDFEKSMAGHSDSQILLEILTSLVYSTVQRTDDLSELDLLLVSLIELEKAKLSVLDRDLSQ